MNCNPITVNGSFIKLTDVNSPPVVETAPFAFLLNRVHFSDGLDYLAEGIPKNITSDICYRCLVDEFPLNETKNAILGERSVTDFKTYNAGDLEMGIKLTSNPFGTITVGFAELKQEGGHSRCFCGNGDLTKNSINCKSSKLFSNVFRNNHADHFAEDNFCNCTEPDLGRRLDDRQAKPGQLMYFEYNNQEDIEMLLKRAKDDPDGVNQNVIWSPTKSKTFVQNISRNESSVGVAKFCRARW